MGPADEAKGYSLQQELEKAREAGYFSSDKKLAKLIMILIALIFWKSKY